MFDLRGVDRLNKWKEFRESLEISQTPLEDLVNFWIRAPFVSDYLDSKKSESWPDPWHLVLDDRLDRLAIVLGMLYTIKLTRRFMDTKCEIHKSITGNGSEFFLIVDNKFLLNFKYGEVLKIEDVMNLESDPVYSK